MNSYESSKMIASPTNGAITPEIIERLIEGDGTEDFVIYDVSDHQLYGWKDQRSLSGDFANRATEAGCDPIVYQCVLWWCFVYIPVVPLGTFAVIPKLECDDPDGDADQYRGIRIEWDWQQIRWQYAIVASIAILLATISFCWWSAS